MSKISIVSLILCFAFNLAASTSIRCTKPGETFESSDTKLKLDVEFLKNTASISYKSPTASDNFVYSIQPSGFYGDTSSLTMKTDSSAQIVDRQMITITGEHRRSTRVFHYNGFTAKILLSEGKNKLVSLNFSDTTDAFPSSDRNIEIKDSNLECTIN